jgi:hypothetical protein
MNNAVPQCAYVNRKVEQVLILENQFCPIGEKCFVKSPTRSTFLHIIFRTQLCVYNKYNFIRCLGCMMLYAYGFIFSSAAPGYLLTVRMEF